MNSFQMFSGSEEPLQTIIRKAEHHKNRRNPEFDFAIP